MSEKEKQELPFIVRFPNFVQEKSNRENPYHSQDHWFYTLSEIRKNLYTNTSATISSPFQHLARCQQNLSIHTLPPSYYNLVADLDKSAMSFRFNSESFAADDIFCYRQLRAEHLLVRMASHLHSKELTYTLSRLSRGIFLVQKYQPSEPICLPLLSLLNNSFPQTANIDTFTFDDLHHMIKQTQRPLPIQAFVPFTYTLGVRYTNPYENASDIVVRGNIPLWCQTLFITECMRQQPILLDKPMKGLLPFLKDMEFRFRRIKDSSEDAYPEMTVVFERFAMELCDPQMIWQDIDGQGNTWVEKEQQVLNSIVLCDIPDEQAGFISSAANQWATALNIFL